MTTHPEFLVLRTAECQAVLARNHVGRLAFSHDRIVDIEPVGYVHDGSWIFMRSAPGTKLQALAQNPFVAFQVDEIDGPFDWRSVVAHGTIYMLPQDGAPIERREFERAVQAMREVMPETLTVNDRTPARQYVYGLHIDNLAGRMARTNPVPQRAHAKRDTTDAR